MPTILLLDTSISMSQSIICGVGSDGNDLVIPFIDLMKSTINYIIQNLKDKVSKFMTDPITLISYSSDIEVLIPFTKDYEEFHQIFSTLDIELRDKTNLENALVKSIDLTQKSFGSTSGLLCDIFIFTDACKTFDNDSQTFKNIKNNIKFPMIHQFHFISLCLQHTTHCHDFERYLQINSGGNNGSTGEYSSVNLNSFFRGSIDIIKYEKTSNLKIELSNTINRIYNSFEMFKGVLSFGHLNSPITFYPNPLTLFHFLNRPYTPPLSLSIMGYISNRHLYNLPTLAIFTIVPLVNESLQGNKSIPPLCPVLQHCSRNEKKSAFVQIQKSWYGMINTTFENDVLVLALSIFEPNIEIPDLCGDISQLEIGQDDQSLTYSIGLSPHTLSYNTVLDPSVIPFLKSDNLQNDFNKVIRLLKSLPAKFESLYIECEKIRNIALIYQPNLLYQLATLIKEELSTNIKIQDDRVNHILMDLVHKLESGSIVEPIVFPINIQQQQLPIPQQQQQQQFSNIRGTGTKKDKKI